MNIGLNLISDVLPKYSIDRPESIDLSEKRNSIRMDQRSIIYGSLIDYIWISFVNGRDGERKESINKEIPEQK